MMRPIARLASTVVVSACFTLFICFAVLASAEQDGTPNPEAEPPQTGATATEAAGTEGSTDGEGDAHAMTLGTRAFGDRWYAGLVASRLENHETTNEGIYFDGWGSELYAQYRVIGPVWLVGGYNYLEPDSDQTQAGEYRVDYAVLGLRYTFDDFRRMIFANVRLNSDLDADGAPRSDVYTVGIRWDLSARGWHQAE